MTVLCLQVCFLVDYEQPLCRLIRRACAKNGREVKKKGHTKSLGEKHPFVARFSLPYGHTHFSLTLFASRWTNKTKDGLAVVCAARGIKLFMCFGR